MRNIALTAAAASLFALAFASSTLAASPLYRIQGGAVEMSEYAAPGRSWLCKIGQNSIVEHVEGKISQRQGVYYYVRVVHATSMEQGRTRYDGVCRGWVHRMRLAPHQSAPNSTWFKTSQPTEIKSEPSQYGADRWQPRGNHKCTIPAGEHVHRDNDDRSGEPNWIYVRWKKKWNHNFEWNYRGHWGPGLNNWCQDWNRHGWVWVGKLTPIGNGPRW